MRYVSVSFCATCSQSISENPVSVDTSPAAMPKGPKARFSKYTLFTGLLGGGDSTNIENIGAIAYPL
jgi:hypothetical protein